MFELPKGTIKVNDASTDNIKAASIVLVSGYAMIISEDDINNTMFYITVKNLINDELVVYLLNASAPKVNELLKYYASKPPVLK